jgi:uncharacterized protein (TIGR00730 family)
MFKTTKWIKRVAIFGDGEAKETDRHFKEAYEVAKLLAENGYIIVNGGGPGVMLAATLGAEAGGGKIEVVVMNPKKDMGNYEGESQENTNRANLRYETESYDERVAKLAEVADAFVVFKGGTGTLSELGMVWSKAKFDFGHHEPIILFGRFWQEIVEVIEKDLGLEETEKEVIKIVEKAEEVIEGLKSTKAGN